MKLTAKDLSTKIGQLVPWLKRYSVIICVILVCVLFGFLAYQINSLTQAEPSDSEVNEKLKTLPRPKLEEDALNRLIQLENEHVEVKTLFQEARNNPFTEP